VLKRPEAWQQELVLALARHRVELAAIEAVVDLGRVTFASRSSIVRRSVVNRLDAAIRQARRLRCRHLLVVPGLLPVGEPVSGIGPRVTALMNECQARAGNAGMRIVVERIERRSDQVGVVLQES
jgi:sugar phosphate isomerase/epimerase